MESNHLTPDGLHVSDGRPDSLSEIKVYHKIQELGIEPSKSAIATI